MGGFANNDVAANGGSVCYISSAPVAPPKHVHTVTKSLNQTLHSAGYICSIINTKLLKYGAKSLRH